MRSTSDLTLIRRARVNQKSGILTDLRFSRFVPTEGIGANSSNVQLEHP
jgi:hypothetical protein